MLAYPCSPATCPSSPLCSVGAPKHLSCWPSLPLHEPLCCDCVKHVTVRFNGQTQSQGCHCVLSFRLMCTPTGQALSPTGPFDDTPQCSVASLLRGHTHMHSEKPRGGVSWSLRHAGIQKTEHVHLHQRKGS